MLLVTSMEHFYQCHFDYPCVVRSEFSNVTFEKTANNISELEKIMDEALSHSVTGRAAVYRIAKTLGELLEDLHEDIKLSSNPNICVKHPNYPEILKYDDLAIQYLLVKMAAGECHWEYFIMLRNLTGAIPNKPDHAGMFYEIKNDWLEWAKANGKLLPLAWDLLKRQ